MHPKFVFLARLLFFTLFLGTIAARAQVLFDNTKAETAGNADWIISNVQPIPSPAFSGITSSTPETYWTGALSAWGVTLGRLANSGQITLAGNGVETLTGAITYGNTSNSQDLSHYKVYVVCEPNIRFTDAEKSAILNFVSNGGGLFMVADHTGSDRNNDGIDSLAVWNDLMFTNSVQTNPFGFSFNADDVTPASATADSSVTNPLTHGLGGTVTTLAYSDGATMSINNSASAHPAVWTTADATKVMGLYGTFGAGRFAAIGDSSVVDDGTGTSGNTLYNGWSIPVDNGYCAINGTVWLLSSSVTNASAPPVVATGAASSVTTNSAVLNGLVNPNGTNTAAKFSYGMTTNYGLSASVSGTLTGSTGQNVRVTVSGLSSSTLYHFSLSATNSAGAANGSDQTFTTAAIITNPQPDLAISLSHTGSFRQGDSGDVYSITVGNVGSLAATGMVSVAESLPAGLTATAISGSGWTANLGALTCSRSDSLSPGSSYPPITVTVSVAANAPLTVTNSATVSGGGDTNSANNTAADVTAIIATGGGSYTGVLLGWDVSGLSNFGGSPLPATSNNLNLSYTGLTRGSGVTTNPSAAARAWGANSWNCPGEAAAITSNQYATFALSAKAGYNLSIGSISRFDYRRSSSGASSGSLQYQLGAGAFIDITNLAYSSSSSGGSIGAIDLSGITALQNIAPLSNVTFRIINYGATGGTWYIYDTAASTALDFSVTGTLSPTASPLTPIQAWRNQYFGITGNTGAAADTAIASSDGMANLLKYALGLNPLTASPNPVTGGVTNGYLRLNVPRNSNATDISFLVETATGITNGWSTNSVVIDLGTPSLIQAHDTNPVPSSVQRYIRLHVTDP